MNGYTNVYPSDTLVVMVTRTKDVGLRLRVERELREEFLETCRLEGKAAAQVLREYMRDYIARNKSAAQRELFTFEAGA
jgi:hypothetical protein